ncbi:phosphoribosylformimino-5-aminoimidazole carboxamide ribotide isomerase [Sphingobacterium sp. IITKGP-BTPF85]|nr:phosphoribosylformimino-5-aminoimidazole carboxamide ribotide isomerase [Sphingobacterium sp. IITKGP-BTPF85]
MEELSSLNEGKVKYADHIVIAIDVLDEVIKYSGWLESSPIKLIAYIDKCLALGFYRFLCTDISKDGKLGGAGVELYKKLLDHSPIIKLIGSGGISSMEDISNLKSLGRMESVVVGKAIYENRISIEEIKDWNLKSLINF